MCSVARQRLQDELIVNDVWERRSENRDRRCEDDARTVIIPLASYRLKQIAGAVKIDRVALLEVELSLTRNDRREVKDQVGPFGHKQLGDLRIGDVGDTAVHGEGAARRRTRLDERIDER